jgi:hypothetical protein
VDITQGFSWFEALQIAVGSMLEEFQLAGGKAKSTGHPRLLVDGRVYGPSVDQKCVEVGK